jgi:hypothetical protein
MGHLYKLVLFAGLLRLARLVKFAGLAGFLRLGAG